MTDPAPALGALLRDLPPVFETEKPVSFDPVQTTFLQKLVREATLKATVTVKKDDFFAAIVVLDWFAEVVAASSTILEDVSVIVEELEKIDEFLDPDLVLLVRYCGLHAVKELKGPKLFQGSARAQLVKRHEKTNAAAVRSGAGVDLFHHAVGRMVRDLVRRDEVRAAVPSLAGRNDLRAALVADAVLRALTPAEAGTAGLAALAKGDVLGATLELLEALVRASAGWSLAAHVAALKKGG